MNGCAIGIQTFADGVRAETPSKAGRDVISRKGPERIPGAS